MKNSFVFSMGESALHNHISQTSWVLCHTVNVITVMKCYILRFLTYDTKILFCFWNNKSTSIISAEMFVQLFFEILKILVKYNFAAISH